MMAGRLVGKRVLVVEDEYFIAADVRRAIEGEGAVVVGPVAQLDRGLALAREARVDAAILDVNLGQGTTYPIADQLREAATPWLFVTGYDEWSMPSGYRDVPRLAKPFTMSVLLDRVVDLVVARPAT